MKKPFFIGIAALVVVSLGAWGWIKLFPPRSQESSEVHTQAVAQEYYTCPMHPSVRSDRPGACPVCQMSLVKKIVQPAVASDATRNGEEYYTCPMHESVHSKEAGACPICGMTLVKKSVQEEMEQGDLSNLRSVSLSPTQRVMANITTANVQRRTVRNDIQAVGIVSYAEPNYRVISMRFPGRVEKLYLSFAGQTVRKGDPVAEVYSPEAIVEEQAYLRALQAYRQTTQSGGESTDPVSNYLRLTREKLYQLGFTEKQISDLVAGLVLVRGVSRRGEIAVRLALGATRARIVRLLIAENLVLAVPGAVLGVLLAERAIPLLVGYAEALAGDLSVSSSTWRSTASSSALPCWSRAGARSSSDSSLRCKARRWTSCRSSTKTRRRAAPRADGCARVSSSRRWRSRSCSSSAPDWRRAASKRPAARIPASTRATSQRSTWTSDRTGTHEPRGRVLLSPPARGGACRSRRRIGHPRRVHSAGVPSDARAARGH